MTALHSPVWSGKPLPGVAAKSEGNRAALLSRKAASKRSAAEGTRAWMTGRVSIQEAQ